MSSEEVSVSAVSSDLLKQPACSLSLYLRFHSRCVCSQSLLWPPLQLPTPTSTPLSTLSHAQWEPQAPPAPRPTESKRGEPEPQFCTSQKYRRKIKPAYRHRKCEKVREGERKCGRSLLDLLERCLNRLKLVIGLNVYYHQRDRLLPVSYPFSTVSDNNRVLKPRRAEHT